MRSSRRVTTAYVIPIEFPRIARHRRQDTRVELNTIRLFMAKEPGDQPSTTRTPSHALLLLRATIFGVGVELRHHGEQLLHQLVAHVVGHGLYVTVSKVDARGARTYRRP